MSPSPYGLKPLCTFRKYPKDPSSWSLSSLAKVRQRPPTSGSVKTHTHTYAKDAQVHTLRAYTHSHTYLYCNVQSHVHTPIRVHTHTHKVTSSSTQEHSPSHIHYLWRICWNKFPLVFIFIGTWCLYDIILSLSILLWKIIDQGETIMYRVWIMKLLSKFHRR